MGPPSTDYPPTIMLNGDITSKINGMKNHVTNGSSIQEPNKPTATAALHLSLYAPAVTSSNDMSFLNTSVPPPSLMNGHDPPSKSFQPAHGYAGFDDRPKQYQPSEGRTLPKDEPLTRYDVERMLHNLRVQKHNQAMNPTTLRPVCRADKCLPPPVPTEHREQALLQLLEKISDQDEAARKAIIAKRKTQYSIGGFLDKLREQATSASMRHVGQYTIDREGVRDEPRPARSLDAPSSSKWLSSADDRGLQGGCLALHFVLV